MVTVVKAQALYDNDKTGWGRAISVFFSGSETKGSKRSTTDYRLQTTLRVLLLA